MKTPKESGHAKNIENFADLINFCVGYGEDFNPSNNSITISSLRDSLQLGYESMTGVNNANAVRVNAVNRRQSIFEPLSKLATRILNALDACDVPDAVVRDALTYVRKIQGRRAKPIVKNGDGNGGTNNGTQNFVSASQQSFDNRIDQFERLITLLETIPGYAPNEEDLKITSLKDLLTLMRESNSDHSEAMVLISNARLKRNDTLYKDVTGVVSLSREVKKYLKSVFGAASAEYKQVRGIRFTLYRYN